MKILASLTNKEGADIFLDKVKDHVEMVYASSGTKKFLEGKGVKCTGIETFTGFAEMLDGRVKTLHPAIFGGILAKDSKEHMDQLKEKNFVAFDVVMCNLYDFAGHMEGTLDEKVENIDIGGVSLIRAAAKNFGRVAILTDPSDYDLAADSILKHGEITLDLRKKLSLKAFRLTASYDAMISSNLSEEFGQDSGSGVIIPGRGVELRYGENPDQKGFLHEMNNYGKISIFHGKEMSYNNYMDASSAIETAEEFDEPFAVVIKHNTPCGAAVGKTHSEALLKAIDADRESAYGSVICINGIVDDESCSILKGMFVEVLIARGFTDSAKELLYKRKNIRLATYQGHGPSTRLRSVFNGILEQDFVSAAPKEITPVVNEKKEFLPDLLFAWKIVAHCRSNAIVLASHGATVGIGAGQTSRVQAAKIAAERAGDKAKGSVMASDAYLPFADNVDVASSSGISAIIQPGGSIRDQDVIDACSRQGISMYFTGKRVFLH
ncbi:MAG: bifunctional phosphoribosylaminoimidazolecarboxamide formyltransferase/IMP cyclohydrolase [Candidatus Thermoplasmatota archaeon]|jgi:phosphoribosylaminoimidazolecarboxamide formyltransferase/IMP cyclohydrolase|nr:bifunctional phosphoribosylaminoimidazolecarboxamide formyltransferase/IMP cyclohydrolase [Candidatus Thermoplasmatota archaeon]